MEVTKFPTVDEWIESKISSDEFPSLTKLAQQLSTVQARQRPLNLFDNPTPFVHIHDTQETSPPMELLDSPSRDLSSSPNDTNSSSIHKSDNTIVDGAGITQHVYIDLPIQPHAPTSSQSSVYPRIMQQKLCDNPTLRCDVAFASSTTSSPTEPKT